MSHEVLAVNLDELALGVEAGRVSESEENTAGGPGELVSCESRPRSVRVRTWGWEDDAPRGLSADSGAGSPPQYEIKPVTCEKDASANEPARGRE